jgi:hypothetical protein
MKLKFNRHDYKRLFKEAIPFGIPLFLDYRMKRIIEKDSEHLLAKYSLENTKDLAMTTKQQLNLDLQYNSFPWFKKDGVLTQKVKESIKNVLDKLEEKKRDEVLDEYHKAVGYKPKSKGNEPKDLETVVILPERITQE